jgi:arabinogalactan oligomer/maltooligosaccharide transport system permease protein
MGLLYLAVEVGVILFLTAQGGGIYWISMLPSLGDREMQEIWNDDKGIFEYVMGDQSQLILLYGIASLCVIAVLVIAWHISVCSGYKAIQLKKAGVKVTFLDSLRTLLDENVHKMLMILPVIAIAIFTVLPLLYMMSMAFTNYSKDTNNLVLFDWVGLDNFKWLFNREDFLLSIRNTLAMSLINLIFGTAAGDVTDYGIINIYTGEELKIRDTLSAGQTVRVYREDGRLRVEKTVDGEKTNIFAALDEDSTLFWMNAGDNVIRMTAGEGADQLTASISFYAEYAGVYDGM